MNQISKLSSALPRFDGTENYYEILGISEEADSDAIKRAFRALAFMCHPDRNPSDVEGATEAFKRVQLAYDTLRDQTLREQYDKSLRPPTEAEVEATGITPLDLILEEILRYRHIFSPHDLEFLKHDFAAVINRGLAHDMGEAVVGCMKIKAREAPVEGRGRFASGSLVLTNLRVLFPHETTWQETVGRTTTIHRELHMPLMFWPEVRIIELNTVGLISTQTHLSLFNKKLETWRITLSHRDVSRLLLLASMWGIEVRSLKEVDVNADLYRVVLRPFLLACLPVAGIAFLMSGCNPVVGVAAPLVLLLPIFLVWAAINLALVAYRSQQLSPEEVVSRFASDE
jgi:hypothetical protein